MRGSSPNNLGAETRLCFLEEPTKSRIKQFVFPVSGDSRSPRPSICMKRFLLAVGRAIITQSIPGKSAPCFCGAHQFKILRPLNFETQPRDVPLSGFLRPSRKKNSLLRTSQNHRKVPNIYKPQLTKTGKFPALKSRKSSLRSSMSVLACNPRASIPSTRK